MRKLMIGAGRLSIAAAGMVALFAGIQPAAAQQSAPPQGWFKVCSKQGDNEICNVQNIIVAQTGQMVTAVSLLEIEGQVNRKVFQVSVPTGRLVPPGIGLQIDGQKPQKIDYAICLPDRCVAEVQLSDAMVASFKKGQEITLTSVNFQQQPSPIKVSLTGFTGAYDGEPMQQSDLQDRQKKLEEFVNKNNEDFAKKLRDEQEKAKTAGN